jgi:hypothetical protein
VLLFFLLEKLLPRVETEVAEAVVSLHHLTLEAAIRRLRHSTLETEAVEGAVVSLYHLTLEVAI